MVAIRTIGPQVSQWVQYNDSSGPVPALILAVRGGQSLGTTRLVAFKPGATFVDVVRYDNLCSAGSWSYFDPAILEARNAGPLIGQIVIFNSASGAQHAFIEAVNKTTGAISVFAIDGSANASFQTLAQQDYTGTIVGTWRFHDPFVGEARTVGPRTGQIVLYNDPTHGASVCFICKVNTSGTVVLYGWYIAPGSTLGTLFNTSVPLDQNGSSGTWRYPDPTVN